MDWFFDYISVGTFWTILLIVHALLSVALLGAISAGTYGAEDGSILATLGAAFTIFVLLALVSATALSLRGGWSVIAVRVLGSWTAATGLLLVGWTLHSHP